MGNKKRQVEPETRSIPLTFVNCPHRRETEWTSGEIMHWCMYDKYLIGSTFKYAYCEGAIKNRMCPRGFA